MNTLKPEFVTDFRGNEVRPGDKIVAAFGHSSSVSLRVGTVDSFQTKHRYSGLVTTLLVDWENSGIKSSQIEFDNGRYMKMS